ncbi:MAG: DUF2341 domain-containing protein [Thermoplasmata archaeon]|nr:DUF2341 domain-containing protein [Thermoplasmata archaeon]
MPPIQFSLREHKVYAAWNPVWTFSKATATIVRQTSSPNASLGAGYIFVVIPREWLHGKYIRWNWQGYGSLLRVIQLVYIYDGAYDRSSDVDFPSGAGKLIKGNGLLQTLDTNASTFPAETKDVQVNVAGGSEDYCTLFFQLSDAWSAYNFWQQIDWVEINDGAAGAGNQYSEHFTDSVHMERTGTTGDYGYISTGAVVPYGDESLFAKFDVRQETSADLLAGFRLRQDVEDLPASFTAAQWQEDLSGRFSARRTATFDIPCEFIARHADSENLFGEIIIRHTNTEDLPGELVARHSASLELHGAFDGQVSLNLPVSFWVKQWRENLLGEFIVRQASSEDLPGECIIRHSGSRELLAGFMIRQIGSADFSGGFITRHSEPGPWLPWRYRKRHTVKGSVDGILTDYVVGFVVYYGAGVDGAVAAKGTTLGKVYCDSKCKTDFGDIRFTSIDGVTELDYWMEAKSDGSYAYFWVKLPIIPLSPGTVDIYIYFGNSSVATTSDGDATFIVFDDFDGDSLDTDKWDENTGGNTPVVEDSQLKVNITAGTYWIDSKIAYDFPDNVEVMARINIISYPTAGYRCIFYTLVDRALVLATIGEGWYRDGDYDRRIYGTSSFWSAGPGKGAGLGISRHAIGTRSYRYLDWFCEGVKNFNDSWGPNNYWPMSDARYLRWGVSGYSQNNVNLYWIAIRKGTENVPTHIAWGPEETPLGQLYAEFDVGQDSEDLAAKFQVGQDSQDLPAIFQSGQGWENLLAEFVVNISASSVDLLGVFDIRQVGSAELLGVFSVLQADSADLLGIFTPRRDASEDLLGQFIVRPSSSVDLAGEFIVRHPASQNLLAVFSAGGIESVDILGVFNVRQADSASLLGIFTSRQADSAELLGIFSASRDASENLRGIFNARRVDSANLLGIFEGQTSQSLLGIFEARRDDSQNLLGVFTPRRDASEDLLASFDGQASVDLLGQFISRHIDSVDLPCEFIVKQAGSANLLGEFEAQHAGSVELFGEFEAQRSSSQELPCEFISRHSGLADLLGEFIVRPSGSANLYGMFSIRRDSSEELLGIFTVRHVGTPIELLGVFEVQHAAYANLLGELVSRQTDSADLFAEFSARRDSSEDLLGVFTTRRDDSVDLPCEFIVRPSGSANLLGEFIARHAASQDLKAGFDGQVSLNLPCELVARHADSKDLPCEFISRHADSVDLKASFDGQASVDLLGQFISRHIDSVDLPCKFIARHSDSVELIAELVIRHAGMAELSAELIVRYDSSVDLLGEFVVRHSTGADLLANFGVAHWQRLLGVFAVRHPYPFWTNRRWLNGVVEMSEASVSDAFLEEIISGVMNDVRTWLIANEAGPYTTWTDIMNTPMAIRRATTYGVVASLYARNVFGPQGRFIVKIAPVDVTILGTNEAAMEYWEGLMTRVLELYLSSRGLDRIWIDTINEDPVFSMEDIPLYTWSPEE